MASGGPPLGQWTVGCCSCLGDCGGCCCAAFCPCVVAGRIAEITSDGFTSSCGACCIFYWLQVCTVGLCGFCYTMGFRNRLRQKYSLPAKPCGDCCMHFFCMCCALAQEYRELKNRGWVPKLGYAENIKLFNAHAASHAPPGAQAMHR